MARDLLNRYIWLVDTISRHGRISRRELDACWARSPFSGGESRLPRRTFYNYRQAVEELFSVTIGYDASTYEYYIADEAGAANITEWLLDSAATSNVLQGSRDVADRIMLEATPSAREFLAPCIEAVRDNHRLQFDYHPYTRSNPTRNVELEPYFLRIFRQIWYVTGRNTADSKVKTYALDRMSDLRVLTATFTPPAGGTDPRTYFRDSFGIMVNRAEPRQVRLRADERTAKYMRALPLHGSQHEEVCNGYSIFTYRLRLTPDLVAEILSRGPAVTVLAPRELRAMVTEALQGALANYSVNPGASADER